MAYPNGTVPIDTPVHPTPIYETLVMGGFALLLWRWRDRWRPGTLTAIYLIGAGLERFLIEFIRRNDAVALGLTQPQWVSLAMMVAGAVWLVVAARVCRAPRGARGGEPAGEGGGRPRRARRPRRVAPPTAAHVPEARIAVA